MPFTLHGSPPRWLNLQLTPSRDFPFEIAWNRFRLGTKRVVTGHSTLIICDLPENASKFIGIGRRPCETRYLSALLAPTVGNLLRIGRVANFKIDDSFLSKIDAVQSDAAQFVRFVRQPTGSLPIRKALPWVNLLGPSYRYAREARKRVFGVCHSTHNITVGDPEDKK